MKSALAIIAKWPVRGQVKTRLCPPLEHEQATELYRAFLLDSIDLIATVERVEPGVLFTPDDACGQFRASAPAHFFLLAQQGATFGERLANGFRALFARGYEAAAIMDADSPTLPRAHLLDLFARLEHPRCDVCVGPCEDGGYWAIGMKHLHPELLTGIAWSTERVLDQTLARARDAGLHTARAPQWWDVDDADALERLRSHVRGSPATGALRTRLALGRLPATPEARIVQPIDRGLP